MHCSKLAVGIMAVVLASGLAGCQKPNMEEMMKPPPRPAELDLLDQFVGTWEGTFEMKMAGDDKVLTGKGTDKYTWDADKWVLSARSEGTFGSATPPNRMFGTGAWVWDGKAKVFRFGMADNYGMLMGGTGKYDAKTRTWHMSGHTRDTIHGQSSCGHGTMEMVDANTMKFHWVETDGLGLMKYFEMNGTSKRK